MKMIRLNNILCIITLCLMLLVPIQVLAEGRTLLYPDNAEELSKELQGIVRKIVDPSTKKV